MFTTDALHLQLALHLVMHTDHTSLLLTSKHILPLHRSLPTPQDILTHARTASTTKHHRPPLALARNLELHSAADRLRDTKRPTQRLHAHVLLGDFPLLQARLKRVCGGGGGGVFGCRKRVGAEAGAEGVVEAWGGGGALGGGADVGEGIAVGRGGDDAERLCLWEGAG